jgi:hypothetical protein
MINEEYYPTFRTSVSANFGILTRLNDYIKRMLMGPFRGGAATVFEAEKA